ncbi:methyltransferase domain-containing protein [Leptospira levettii]|uniref:methyltransferase domain-containing protein n=2 Tax=Leptospira levettii TaxID=2023178 RepID=UPI0010830F84|nr:methyltransferase domain-containing protein [Leptospira levettii]TGM89280.1 methyltransferase domain-containing protein [Leptospira levettii]
MDKQTIDAYDRLTDTYFERQERFHHSYISEIEYYLKESGVTQASVLDIGTGSGKFVEQLNSKGWNAIGIEPSSQILDRISASHPHRALKIQKGSLPHLPTFSESFHLISAFAVLLHIPKSELFLSILNIKQNLKVGGYFVFSLPENRTDLDNESRDKEGRLHCLYHIREITLILEQLGFQVIKESNFPDSEGRGWSWSFCIAKLEHKQSLPLDTIDSILNRERKTATYKPALLRALCDIALENQNVVEYESDHVFIPIRLVAEKWVVYFWNLFSAPIYLPQVSSDKMEKPSSLRKTFASLHSKLNTLDDFLEKQALFHSGKLIDMDLQKDMNLFLGQWEQTIIKGPIQYSSNGDVFRYDPNRQMISVPITIWREFVLLESWIRDAVILRWAEEIERLSRKSVRTGQAIDYLMMGQNLERKQNQVRSLFLEKTDLACIWTGKPLNTSNLDIDHGIPYAYWKNNFLWNLFPADAKSNRMKSDKIPSSELILKRELPIRDHWKYVFQLRPNQFTFELKNFLGKYYEAKDWDKTLFSMFQESAETIASRRGALRWEGE